MIGSPSKPMEMSLSRPTAANTTTVFSTGSRSTTQVNSMAISTETGASTR